MKEEIIKLYTETHLNCKQIASRFEINPSTVERTLKSAGIQLDKYSRRYYRDLKFDYFANTQNENSLYYAGFIAADGNLYQSQRTNRAMRLTIEIDTKDREILEKFDIGANIIDKDYSSMTITSNKICGDLERNYLVTPRKSATLKFPDHIHDGIQHFIRGYFDGDGCFHIKKRGSLHASFIGSKPFINSLHTVLPCKSSIYNRNGKFYSELKISERKEELIKFIDFLYKDSSLYLTRKKAIADLYMNKI